MSNFICDNCGKEILEGDDGRFVTGCAHYPIYPPPHDDNDIPLKAKETEKMKKYLLLIVATMLLLGSQVSAANNFVSQRDGAGNPATIITDPSSALGLANWDGSLFRGKTLKFATISTSASGATAIVAAVTGKKIKVVGCWLCAGGTVNVKWQSATTDITGLVYLFQGSGYVLPTGSPGSAHWFETAAGAALNINLSAAIAVGGSIVYYEE